MLSAYRGLSRRKRILLMVLSLLLLSQWIQPDRSACIRHPGQQEERLRSSTEHGSTNTTQHFCIMSARYPRLLLFAINGLCALFAQNSGATSSWW